MSLNAHQGTKKPLLPTSLSPLTAWYITQTENFTNYKRTETRTSSGRMHQRSLLPAFFGIISVLVDHQENGCIYGYHWKHYGTRKRYLEYYTL